MDGVLVEVTESYREAVRATVQHFTGELVSHDEIQDFKNAGGWNNDWALSHRMISDRGKNVEYGEVVDQFNRIFIGNNGDGLMRHEKWMASAGVLERLSERCVLAIFTGRVKYEVDLTLGRYGHEIRFAPIITDECVANPKPAPDGLLLIQRQFPGKTIWYLGDTVDDARSSLEAGVPFVGVSTPRNPRHLEIADLLRGLGAFTVVQHIDELEAVIDGMKQHV
jgi:HAD superfamily phosphatase